MPNIRDVPIPKRMRALDRDPRGYPIPFLVWVDREGRPHFTINDEGKRMLIYLDDLCSLCGQKLLKVRWLIGGPMSAFHPRGTYMDPPVHRDCGHYALKVCPWLAVPSYGQSGKRIDTKTVSTDEKHRVFTDHTQIKERPVVFVAVGTTGQDVRFHPDPREPIYVTPHRPYAAVEFWRHGKQITPQAAGRLLRESAEYEVPADAIDQRDLTDNSLAAPA